MATIPNYEGVTGTMQFQEGSGDPIKSAVILQIKDGKFNFLCQRQSINLNLETKIGLHISPILVLLGYLNMTYLLQQALNALQLSSIYALIALGYTMVYGILRMINFAHGDLFMVGAFFSFIIATFAKLPVCSYIVTCRC